MNRNDSSIKDKLYGIDTIVDVVRVELSQVAADSLANAISMAALFKSGEPISVLDAPKYAEYCDTLSFALCAAGVEYLAQCACVGVKSLYQPDTADELFKRWDIVGDVFAKSRKHAEMLCVESLDSVVDYPGVLDIESAYEAALETKGFVMRVMDASVGFSERAAAVMAAATRWAAIVSWAVDEGAQPLERQGGFWENAA